MKSGLGLQKSCYLHVNLKVVSRWLNDPLAGKVCVLTDTYMRVTARLCTW